MGVVGYVLGGRSGVWMALVFSAVSALVSPAISPRMILRMYQARPLEPRHAPELYALLDELVKRAELAHPPALYYVPTRMLNAFAVGGDRNAAIALTDGLMRTMTPRELSGILAHELSHVRYKDTRLMALGDVFSRLTAIMSQIGQLLLLLALPAALMGAPFISLWGLLVLIFAPAASTMLQLALSRSREFHADMGAIELTQDPVGLASALKKLRARAVRLVLAADFCALPCAGADRAAHASGYGGADRTIDEPGQRGFGIVPGCATRRAAAGSPRAAGAG